MHKKREKTKKEIIKMQISLSEDKVVEVGKYDPNTNIFIYSQSRMKDFRRDANSWTLDAKVLDVLVNKRAKIVLKETDNKWQFECEAVDFKYYGKPLEREGLRTLFLLPLKHWEITKVTQKSMIVECLEEDCRYNFGKQCTRGTIKLDTEGVCVGYEDKY